MPPRFGCGALQGSLAGSRKQIWNRLRSDVEWSGVAAVADPLQARLGTARRGAAGGIHVSAVLCCALVAIGRYALQWICREGKGG